MPIVAVAIQQKDGTNLLLQSRANASVPQAIELASDFARKIGKIRAGDMGPFGPRKVEPNFASGKLSILKHYQASYALLTDVYLLVIQHREDNPFHEDYVLNRARSVLEGICKDVNQIQIQKRFADVFIALERLFDASQEETADWHTVERLHHATRARTDLLFGVEFRMPQGSYTPSDIPTPRVFGDAFLFQEPFSKKSSSPTGDSDASELPDASIDETIEISEADPGTVAKKKRKVKSVSGEKSAKKKPIKGIKKSKDKETKTSKDPKDPTKKEKLRKAKDKSKEPKS